MLSKTQYSCLMPKHILWVLKRSGAHTFVSTLYSAHCKHCYYAVISILTSTWIKLNKRHFHVEKEALLLYNRICRIFAIRIVMKLCYGKIRSVTKWIEYLWVKQNFNSTRKSLEILFGNCHCQLRLFKVSSRSLISQNAIEYYWPSSAKLDM